MEQNINTEEQQKAIQPQVESPITPENKDLLHQDPLKFKEPKLIDISDHGYSNGLWNVEKELFVPCIEAWEELPYLKEKIAREQAELFHKERELSDTTKVLIESEGILEKNSLKSEALSVKIGRLKDKQQKHEITAAELKDKADNIKTPYGNVAIGLYILVGIAFIACDISVTKDIVSKGLNMAGIEGWVFAVGLALTAFAIKPAVERIFEKPYYENNKRVRNHWFIGTVAVIAIITLGLFGYFRGEAHKIHQQLATKTMELDDLKDQKVLLGAGATGEINAAIRKLESEKMELEGGLANNMASLVGIILSSILFAVAGAICLSIGIPAAEKKWQKSNLRSGLKKEQKAYELTLQELDLTENEQIKLKQEAKEHQVKLKHQPDKEKIMQQVERLQDELNSSRLKLVQAGYKRDHSLYHDSYDRGIKIKAAGYEPELPDNKKGKTEKPAANNKPVTEKSEPNSDTPKLRHFSDPKPTRKNEVEELGASEKIRKMLLERYTGN
jgi:hypothetical protein